MFLPPSFKDPISLGALPFKKFQAAVDEGTNNLQTPSGMSLLVALTAASLTVQGCVDVKIPTGQEVGAAIMAVIVANSGERKSAMEGVYFKIIRQWEELHRARYEIESAAYKREHEVWKATGDVKKKRLKKQIEKGECADQEAAVLRQHLTEEPVPPVLLKLLYEDSTLPALFQGLRGVPSAGLISSEGGGVLDGPIFSEQTKLNAIWSGSPVTIDRVTTGSYVLSGVRLTVLVMVQPGMLKVFIAEKGEKARSSGLLARVLFWNTGTTQGSRLLQNTTVSWEHCDRFNQRIAELLEQNVAALKDPNFKRKVLKFSPQAEIKWLQYYNYVEANIQANGRYAQAGDHASKLAENVARVAGVLHLFEGFEGDISYDTLMGAMLIVDASSQYFIDIITPPPEFHEANFLDSWFTQKYRSIGCRYIVKRSVRNGGPHSLRNTPLLERLFDILVQSGRIMIIKKNKTEHIDLFPMNNFLPAVPMNNSVQTNPINSI